MPDLPQLRCTGCHRPLGNDVFLESIKRENRQTAVPWCPDCREPRGREFDECWHCGRRMRFGTGRQSSFCSAECRQRNKNDRRRHDRVTYTRTCERCGVTFTARRFDARYCSVTCRVAAHRAG